MKIKIFIAGLLLTFVLTGCKANYTLEIKDGKIKETLNSIEKVTNIDTLDKDQDGFTFSDYAKYYGEEKDINTNYYELHSQEECDSTCTYYDKKSIRDDENIGFELEHVFDMDNYEYSSIGNELVPNFSAYYDGRFLTIVAGSKWSYLKDYKFLSEVNINIDTNYKVLNTNLKKESDGHYTTTINNSVINDDYSIIMYLDTKDTIKENDTKKESSKNSTIKILILVIIGLVISLFTLIIYNRKKNNK